MKFKLLHKKNDLNKNVHHVIEIIEKLASKSTDFIEFDNDVRNFIKLTNKAFSSDLEVSSFYDNDVLHLAESSTDYAKDLYIIQLYNNQVPQDITPETLFKVNECIKILNELKIDGETFDYITDELGFTDYVDSKYEYGESNPYRLKK